MHLFSNPKTYEGNDIPKQTKWVYSVVAMFRDATYALVSLFLITYAQYSGVLGTDANQFPAMLGVMTGLIIGYRIFDAINDPWMGAIIEKCHFKFGKYKPWIMIGGVASSIITLLLFIGPQMSSALTGWGYVAWFAVFYLLWGIAFTINDISYWGLLPSLTNDEKQRTAITTIMNIFCSIGQFAVAGLMPVFSGMPELGSYGVYIPASIIICSLMLVSQIIAGFGIVEHKRNDSEETKQKVATVTEMFKILKNDKQVRTIFIVLFFYYLGSGILNALGLNYFYFAVDFSNGGFLMTLFTIVYGLGMIISQFFFPLLSSKFTRKQLMDGCIIASIVGYIAFFIYGLKLDNGSQLAPNPVVNGQFNIVYFIPLVFIGLIIFLAQGVFYMTLLIMSQDVIEYHEVNFYERKEGVIFALRPFATKFSSSLQQGFLYLFLMISGLITPVFKISEAQNFFSIIKNPTEAEQNALNDACNNFTQVDAWQTNVFKIGVAILPLLCLLIAYFIYKKNFIVDEKLHKELCLQLEARKSSESKICETSSSIEVSNEPSNVEEVKENISSEEKINTPEEKPKQKNKSKKK